MLGLNVEILKITIKSLTGEINWCKCDLHYNESCGLMFGLINVTASSWHFYFKSLLLLLRKIVFIS